MKDHENGACNASHDPDQKAQPQPQAQRAERRKHHSPEEDHRLQKSNRPTKEIREIQQPLVGSLCKERIFILASQILSEMVVEGYKVTDCDLNRPAEILLLNDDKAQQDYQSEQGPLDATVLADGDGLGHLPTPIPSS